MKKFILILISFLSFTLAKSQCIDSTLIQPGAFCSPEFNPVCGCDGITYKNIGCALLNGVINYNSGVCGGIDFDFNPNPVVDILYMRAMINVPGSIRLIVIDRYGKMFHNISYSGVQGGVIFQLDLDLAGMPYGYYWLYAETETGYKIKPFIKFEKTP